MEFYTDEKETIAGCRRPQPRNADERYMLRALELAEMGRGRTWPNPLVGSVVVKEGEIIGEGYHEFLGGPHAEVNALSRAGGGARGSTMYVTLEPCVHHGRTPPCVGRVAESGVRRVLIAMRDPNPLVDGKGVKALGERGIEVVEGLYGHIAGRQNEAYVKRIRTGMPYVTLKMALSIDGKTATRTGDSKWISSDESRDDVHRMRSYSDAVMVGIGTVLSDDPRLTVRRAEPGVRSPVRVVVDGAARTPVGSNVAIVSEAPTIVAAGEDAPVERLRELEAAGIEILRAGRGERVDLKALLSALGERGITSLLVEGGAELAWGLWDDRLVDKTVFYVAPLVIGGRSAPGAIGGEGVGLVSEALPLSIESVSVSGGDLKVVAYPRRA